MVCQRCWRPVLESHGEHLYCPTCDTEYSNELEIISGPSIDVFHRNVVSLIGPGDANPLNGDYPRLTDIVENFGIDPGAPTEKWIMAVHHLETLYGYYRSMSRYPGIHQDVLFPAPASKRSYPGSFYKYDSRYYRRGASPFSSLSDNAFMAAMNIDKSSKCFTLPPAGNNKGGYYCGDEYQLVNWQNAVDELVSADLIRNAPLESNLNLLTVKEIHKKLKEHGIKSKRVKGEAIATAVKSLSDNILKEMIEHVRGYEWAPRAIQEFSLWEYELRNLGDRVRYHNLHGNKVSVEEFLNQETGKLPDTILEIIVALLERARGASNYNSYLEKGLPPAEAYLAEAHAQLGDFNNAYREIKLAYKLDIKYNDIAELSNITHFGSLTWFQLQLEIIMTQFLDPPYAEIARNAHETADVLRKWRSLYDRANSNGVTSFLLSNYENIFATMGNCSIDSENRYREIVGVPRIGEGWVSEVELLNFVKDIFQKEKVIHQGSPGWLGLQRLDIYLPRLKLAIEYQGRQHYEPVPFFGGEEGFSRTQNLDRRKAKLCAENDVTLIYFRFDEKIGREMVESRIRNKGK
jgi:hypothetical protein